MRGRLSVKGRWRRDILIGPLVQRRRTGYIQGQMLDRLFLPALAALAVVMIALAMAWPQGLGARSVAPFGHTPVQQTPAMQAAMKREADDSNKGITRARQAVQELQARRIAPSQ